MRVGVADSALKRRDLIDYSDIQHVVRTADFIGVDADGLVWWLGSTPTGLDIEIAAITAREGDALIVIHAFPMKWRKR